MNARVESYFFTLARRACLRGRGYVLYPYGGYGNTVHMYRGAPGLPFAPARPAAPVAP